MILSLFRLIPMWAIRLSSVENMRRSTHGEFFDLSPRRIFLFWKYWFWPYPMGMFGCPARAVYRIKLRYGFRVWVRLTTGVHYQLREYTNREQIQRQERLSARRSAATSG